MKEDIMSLDPLTLAGQILKALDTGSGLPSVMETILDEVQRTPSPDISVQQIIDQVSIYPGADYDDDRQQAIALLQYVLKEYHE
jgi:hypothetical protein